MKVCPTCNRVYRSGVAVCPRDGSLLGTLREWRPGDSVSERFRIVEKIGHGSMGPAFRAKVLPFGGLRVLKSLSVQLADDEPLIDHFQQEIKAASALRHLNAAHIESLERSTDGRPFIVMEYVPGLSLRELLSRGGHIPALDVVDIIEQICAALDCAHWLGIIHRNLKPDNVIIAEEHDGAPRVKVMEFGMANLREAAAGHGRQVGDVVMTDQGTVIGAVEYMSPEQAAGTPTSMLDGRSDLYSVGVLMFEALTGDLPLAAEDPMSLLYQKQDIAANELLCATVLKALQKDPDYRFQSTTEMIAALREVSYSLSKTPSLEAGFDIETEPAKVSLSMASQPLIESAQGPPLTSAGLQHEEHATPRIPDRVSKPPQKPLRDAAAASTDRDIDQIRKAWTHAAGQAVARRGAQSSQVRTGLLVVGVLMIVSLALWVVYRGPGLLLGPRERGIEGQSSSAPQQTPARDQASDLGSQEAHPIPTEPPPDQQEPAAMKKGNGPLQPAASDDKRTPQALASPGRQSDPQKADSAAGVGAADKRAAVPIKKAELPTVSQAPLPREAEVRGKMAIGWFFVERKDYRAAIESFTEVLKIDPSNIEAQAALRLARYASQNPDVDVLPSSPSAAGDGSVKR